MSGKDPKFLKTEFPDKRNYFIQKKTPPYKYFKSIDEYRNLATNSEKENFFSKLKNDYLSDKETERTKKS